MQIYADTQSVAQMSDFSWFALWWLERRFIQPFLFSFNIRPALPCEATWQPVETNILWLSAAGITVINL